MKILVIGGTRFVGRHFVAAALERGHELTLFHRGRTNDGLFQVETIHGDRDGETDRLAGRTWDAVLDTCGYFPRIVEQSADQLCDHVSTYAFISTISVYAESDDPSQTESSELARFQEEPSSEEVTGESYGPFKVLCEEAVQSICGPERALIVRPGLIVGPDDPTDRFTYWVDRFSGTKPVLVPERESQPVQFIDVRDLAAFTLHLLETGASGVYNATGPAERLTLGEYWNACRAASENHPSEHRVPDAFLEAHGVKEWQDLPLLTPKGEGFFKTDVSKGNRNGLTFRPLAETVRDTLAFHRGRGDIDLKAGLTRERESQLIHEAQQSSAGAP